MTQNPKTPKPQNPMRYDYNFMKYNSVCMSHESLFLQIDVTCFIHHLSFKVTLGVLTTECRDIVTRLKRLCDDWALGHLKSYWF